MLERDGEREHADERPAERHLRRSAHHEAVRVERHGAGQDRDDRERDREVREAAHRPEQLLGVAERVQLAGIVVGHSATPDRRVSSDPHEQARDFADRLGRRFSLAMDAADGRRRGVIEIGTPARSPGRIAAVREIRRQRVESGAGPLADQVDDGVRVDERADVIAGAHAPVLNDHVDVADVQAGRGELAAQRRQHRAQVLVQRVGVEAVRDHDLHLRAPRTARCASRDDPLRIVVANRFSRSRVGEVVLAVARRASGRSRVPGRRPAARGRPALA